MNRETLPIVLVPGFMLDETLWDDFVAAFPQERTFIRAGLNHGDSISAIAPYIVDDLPPRFILIGFSLGGYVTRAIVEQYPQAVAGLVLIATSLREDSAAQQKIKQAAIAAVSASSSFNGISPSAIAGTLHPQRAGDKTLVAKIRAMGARLGAEAFRHQASLVRDHLTTQPITCPTLVIAAAQDPSRSLDELQELQASITGAELQIIDDCGHMLPLEQPAQLAKAVSEWIEKWD